MSLYYDIVINNLFLPVKILIFSIRVLADNLIRQLWLKRATVSR